MGSFENIILRGFTKKGVLIFSLLLSGLLIRFYHQFIEWSFNGDEVDLGLEIVGNSLKDLFFPFNNRQSAPPLFLLLEKLISVIGKPFISLKILSFLSSCASLLLFNRILKKHFPFYLQIFLLVFFCFNPFIIGNSLTLKQYSIDLTLGLVAVNYFINTRSSYKIFYFFSIFCLLSNAGLFFCTSMAIFLFSKLLYEKNDILFWKGVKKISPFILAPIPYFLFFVWFMLQPGAENLRNYMTGYWSGAFMPVDLSVFNWMAIQAKVIMIFFFSTYWIVGVPLILLFLYGLFSIFKKKIYVFQNKLLCVIFIYIVTAIVHISFSALRLYPFSDRLFLYLAPGIYLILGFGISEINKKIKKRFFKKVYYSTFLLSILIFILYFTYLPRKENDVAGLLKFINSTEQKILITRQAKQTSLKWLDFTKFDEMDSARLINAERLEISTHSKADFLIAVQSSKFGHLKRLSTPEPIIDQLLATGKIILFQRVGGYVIYKIK